MRSLRLTRLRILLALKVRIGGHLIPYMEAGLCNDVFSSKAATTQIIDALGMQPIESSGTVPDRATTHTLLLAGIFIGGVPIVARCRMAFEPSSGVTMELAVRSPDAVVGQKIANAIS